jgi:hypothetical protein
MGATLAVVAVLALAGYWASLLIHPNRPCRMCREHPTTRGAVFTYSRGKCFRCGGSGVMPRFGRRFIR